MWDMGSWAIINAPKVGVKIHGRFLVTNLLYFLPESKFTPITPIFVKYLHDFDEGRYFLKGTFKGVISGLINT